MKFLLGLGLLTIAICAPSTAFAPHKTLKDSLAVSAQNKFDSIKHDKAKRGSAILLSGAELNAWVKAELAEEAQLGIHDTKVVLGQGTFEISAIVDFRKIAESGGKEINAMFAKLLEGERPLKIAGTLEATGGHATLHLTNVEISGIPLSGLVLDLVVKVVVGTLAPDAKVNEPFDLEHNMDRIEITASNARVTIKK
ncbi:MAG: hypothetical protein ABI824_09275 [Acidobacteriota bacterium]